MSDELNEESTPEEIDAKVDEIVAERTVEKPTDDKTDAQMIAGDHEEPVTVKEDKTEEVSEEKETKEEVAEEPEEEAPEKPKWLDDALTKQASAYGIDEEDLADFTSREEVERAMRLFDKSAQQTGQEAQAAARGKDEPEGEADETKPEGYEVKLDKEEWSEELVEEFTKLRDHYETRIEAIESRFADQDAQLEEQKFDGLVDSLDHADLFGKSGKETKKELQRREDLLIAAKAQVIGLKELGRPVDLDESLVARVANMVFADELGKKKLKARTKRISKQSNRRQGGSATKPHEAPESPLAKAERRYKELDDSQG